MDWSAKVFIYCERGLDPSFWAEPLNALSNLSFVIAALLAARLYVRGPRPDHAVAALIGLVAIVGGGSFLFHTFATRWSALADVLPIAIFMIAYTGFALRRFAGAPWWVVILGLLAFVGSLWAARRLPCTPDLMPITAAAGYGCFNGSVGYVPALVALALMSGYLAVRRHAAWPLLGISAVVFAVSLAFRTVDFEVCGLTELLGRARGTHALWHLLNGLMLYMLLQAAVVYGRRAKIAA